MRTLAVLLLLLGACASKPRSHRRGPLIKVVPKKAQPAKGKPAPRDIEVRKNERRRVDKPLVSRSGAPESVKVGENASLQVEKTEVKGYSIEAGARGRVDLEDAKVERIELSSRSRLTGSRSRIGELVMTGEASATLMECEIGTLVLSIRGIAAEFSGLKVGTPVDWVYEPTRSYRVELKRCRVGRYAFELSPGSRIELTDCPGVSLLFEVASGASTFEKLRTGDYKDESISNRNAGIAVRLIRTHVAGWGVRSLNDAVLSAIRCDISRAESRSQSRMVLMDCDLRDARTVSNQFSSMELEQCRVLGRGRMRFDGSSRLTLTKCRVDNSIHFEGFGSGILEAKEMGNLPPPALWDHSRFLIEGREAE